MDRNRDPKAFADWFEPDYFTRRRSFAQWLSTAGWAAVALSLVSAAWALWPANHSTLQAGPVSSAHAMFANECRACHSLEFRTAMRLLPHMSGETTVSDEDCRKCHESGRHHERQNELKFINGIHSSNCGECHHEHRGKSLVKLEDKYCTRCHADLPAHSSETPAYAAKITHFNTDHPEFGAWRGKTLEDPGTIAFNHKLHMDLPNAVRDWPADRQTMIAEVQRLGRDQCQYCHQTDDNRQNMKPVNFNDHCKACHEGNLTPRSPGGSWSGAERKALTAPLRHPGGGETVHVVRDELIGRIAALMRTPEKAGDPAVRPELLNRELWQSANKKADQIGESLFVPRTASPDDPLKRMESALAGGCLLCHQVDAKKPASGGFPALMPGRIRDRWADTKFHSERMGSPEYRTDARRWFPLAKFGHESHRMLDCNVCHQGADKSTSTSQVLMPSIQVCKECHKSGHDAARADCLECHFYHDRSHEGRTLKGRFSLEEALRGGTNLKPNSP